MPTWNDIKRNVSGAAKYTVKKTGKVTNIAKIKISLRGEQTKLEKCYEEIGRLSYFAQRRCKNYTAEIATLMLEADDIRAKIAETREKLEALQRTVNCRECGSEINRDAAFCEVCGARQQ